MAQGLYKNNAGSISEGLGSTPLVHHAHASIQIVFHSYLMMCLRKSAYCHHRKTRAAVTSISLSEAFGIGAV